MDPRLRDRFAALHRPGDPVLLYNIWDFGSAQAVAKGGALASMPHFPHTEEICTAIRGEIEVQAGDERATIEPYKSIHYSADVPHTIRNKGGQEAVCYLAVRYQRD